MVLPGFGKDAGPLFEARNVFHAVDFATPQLKISREGDVAIVNCATLAATVNTWRLLLDELNRLDCATVVDTRSMTGSLSEIDTYLVALHVSEMEQFRRNRMAIVSGDDPESKLGFFVTSVKNFGLSIEKFDCVDKAITWASAGSCPA